MADVEIPSPAEMLCVDNVSVEGKFHSPVSDGTDIYRNPTCRVTGRKRNILAVKKIECLAIEEFDGSVEVAVEEFEICTDIE